MDRRDIEQFFDEYAAAAMAGEPERTAALYTPSFIAAGPKGSATFANDDAFQDWLRSLYEFNRQVGMRSMSVASVDERRLSATHAIAEVEWGARFERTGDRIIRFRITYVLERLGNSWKVLAYISHADQEEEMRRLRLI